MKKTIGCLAIMIALLGGGGWFLAMQIPDVTEQMPPNASPIVVTLTTPPNDTSIPLDDFTTITADALGPQPIVSLELWVDGALGFKQTAPTELRQFTATWTWTPPSEGTHTLVARAMDARQYEGQSNIVQVVATQGANPTTQVTYKSRAGDTFPVIARKFQTPPQQVIDANPQINPDNPLAPGQDVSVPIPIPNDPGPGADNSTPDQSPGNPPPPPPDPGQGAPQGPPNKWLFWLKGFANLFSKSNPPAKPELAAVVDGCNVKLTITDHALNEDGFYIDRTGKIPSLKPIATLGAHDGATAFAYPDPNLAQGQYVYYVVAFNPAGDALSNPVQVKIIDGKCTKQVDVHQFQNPNLKIAQPLDKVYCYLKINNGDWQRIPDPPNTFLVPTKQGTFDVSAYLKGLPLGALKSQMILELDCWGWKGNDLIYLGNAKETVGPGKVQMKADQFEFTGVLPGLDLPTGITPPSPSPLQFLEASLSSIAPPTKLRNAANAKECSSHMPGGMAVLGGELACQEALAAGNYAVLVWEWIAACWPGDSNCALTIDGYRVYREDFPAPALVKEVQNQDLRTAMFPLPSQPWPPGPNDPLLSKLKYAALLKNCYFVRAYVDGVGESPDGNQVCLPLNPGVKGPKTVQIPASYWLTRAVDQQECNAVQGAGSMHGSVPSATAQELEVGFYYTTEGCNFAWVARGATWFDVSTIPANAWITQATLQYTLVKTDYTTDIASNEHHSCANRLLLGKEAWMGKNFGDQKYWIPGENYQYLPSGTVPLTLNVDVTSAVKEWVQGTRPNYGLVFRQSEEGMHTDWDLVCDSIYKDFGLAVTYTPKN